VTKYKIGQKRTEPKIYRLKRAKIKPVSNKRSKEQPEYTKISNELKEKAGYKSELSTKSPSKYNPLVIHHILGRNGNNYTNPFALLVCLESEHQTNEDAIHKHNSYEKKQELLSIVKPIRIEQGFKLEDYA